MSAKLVRLVTAASMAVLIAVALWPRLGPAASVSAAGLPPDPPTSVTARAADARATIAWVAPVFTDGQQILGYTASVEVGGPSCTAAPPATSCTIVGLANGVAYRFVVTATTAGGTSGPSSPSIYVTPLAGSEGVNLIGTYGVVKWSAGTIGAAAPPADPLQQVYGGSRGYLVGGTVDATTVNDSLCGAYWAWYQILCDLPGARDELARVYKSNNHSGITYNTWLPYPPYVYNPDTRGYVVIDLGAVRTFTTLRVFQMFSDGKVTDAQLSVSDATGDTWPTIDDVWTVVAPRTGIGTGVGTGAPGYVTCPTILDFGARSARYVRLDFWNAGQFGNPAYIEVSAAKLFFEDTVPVQGSGCPPEPPTAVHAVAGNASAEVGWNAGASADPLTANQVQYSADDGASWSWATTVPDPIPGTATSAVVTGLTNGNPYRFRVAAANGAGTSPWSLPSSPVTPAAVPDAPTNVVATAGNASASITWTASTTSGSAVTGYTVTSSPDGRQCSTGPATTTCVVSGLRNTVPYTVSVVAHSDVGDSLAGVSGRFIPLDAVAPTIAAFSPVSGPPGTVVTIAGTGFTDVQSAKIGGVNVAWTVVSPTRIVATTGPTTRSGPVTVSTPGGTATSSGVFTVSLGPALLTFSPVSGRVGTLVTVSGANLQYARSVTIGGKVAVFSVRSPSTLVATVPAGAVTGRIVVSGPYGSATSSANFFVLP